MDFGFNRKSWTQLPKDLERLPVYQIQEKWESIQGLCTEPSPIPRGKPYSARNELSASMAQSSSQE